MYYVLNAVYCIVGAPTSRFGGPPNHLAPALVPIKLHIVTDSGISAIIKTCFIILSLQFSPVIQNCIYRFCTHSVSQF